MSKPKRRNPNSYPTSVRDRVTIDYENKLSPTDRDWLAAFNESEYGGNAEHAEDITGVEATQDEKRKAWREAKRRQRDIYPNGGRLGADHWPDFMDDLQAKDSNPAATEDAVIDLIDAKDAAAPKPADPSYSAYLIHLKRKAIKKSD